jgi:probable HAF family extracellular repeat protein
MQEKFSKKLRIMLLTVAALALACGNALAGYTLTDLSTQGSMRGSWAIGINNNGDVVGMASFIGNTYQQAALWRNGVAYDLGTLGGNGSVANDINDYGVVVGEAGTIGQGSQAFKWDSSNGMQALPTLGGDRSVAGCINSAGQIVGSAFNSYDQIRPVLWDGGGIQTFGVISALYGGHASEINNAGQIVGMIADANNQGHAMLWSNGVAQDLGTFGGGVGGSGASAINDAGQVVINTNTYGSYWSTSIWSNGSLQNLPNLGNNGAVGGAINSSGLVVGTALGVDGNSHAVLWQNGEIIDLNSFVEGTGWTLLNAIDINDKGQIVGTALNSTNTFTAFLLTPDAAPVPIPAALPLFGSGLAVLGFLRRKLFRA